MLPRKVKTITLTSAGHSFVTEVVDVTLLAREAEAS
jgi:DNA-binding MurR/RpiR family transcriptional regulator